MWFAKVPAKLDNGSDYLFCAAVYRNRAFSFGAMTRDSSREVGGRYRRFTYISWQKGDIFLWGYF